MLGLQEAVVVGMADGYAQATRNAAFVNLHSAAGVGHAMGNIFTAYRNRTPLVITAGQQARSILPYDPFLYSAQATELPKPYVKWSCEPARAEDVPLAIARAYYIAMQPPRGPVLVSIPADDWAKPCEPCRRACREHRDPARAARAGGDRRRARRVVASGLRGRRGRRSRRRVGRRRAARRTAQRGGVGRADVGTLQLPGGSRALCRIPSADAREDRGPARGARRDLRARRCRVHLPRRRRRAASSRGRPAGATDRRSAHRRLDAARDVRGGEHPPRRAGPARARASASARTSSSRRSRPPRVEPSSPMSAAFVMQTLAEIRDPASIVVEEAPSSRRAMQEPSADPAQRNVLHDGQRRARLGHAGGGGCRTGQAGRESHRPHRRRIEHVFDPGAVERRAARAADHVHRSQEPALRGAARIRADVRLRSGRASARYRVARISISSRWRAVKDALA